MNQTALNLTAITIFTVVMASLLGPLVHLSPLIPAIAVAGMLGLATVDTLGWQGRGATLLLDWVARVSPEHRTRVIRHEAGHFLVAQRLGIPITGYTLSAWEALRQGHPGAGGVTFDLTELDAELAQGTLSSQLIDRYCTVWMAGLAAETLTYGAAEGGADDRQKIGALFALLKRPATEADVKAKWATLQAKTLLQQHWPQYEALVTAMQQRASVEDCKTIVSSLLEAETLS